MVSTADLRCSFCNKLQSEVEKLIAGRDVFICDECVEVCNDIIADDNRFTPPKARMKASGDAKPSVPFPTMLISGAASRCVLCGMLVPKSDVIPVRERGVLCPGCVGEVEAAIAERRQSDQ